MNDQLLAGVRGAVGGFVGAVLGYFAFAWLARQGFYALVIPGSLIGMGCAVLMQRSSNLAGILCGVAALPVSLLSEWKVRPFIADPSLGYFVGHLKDLSAVTWIMVVLGVLFAYWLGKGRDDFVMPSPDTPPPRG